MIVIETVIVAFSMYSALPMPQIPWKEENLHYALCAFPLVGVVIALLCGVWVRLCIVLSLPSLIQGAGLCLLPALMTGGIHLDGYADTWDARSSHAEPEKRQEILKDPHMGAFAAIHLMILMLARFALCCSLRDYDAGLMFGIFTLSRALSGLSAAVFPLAKRSGLLYTFVGTGNRRRAAMLLGCCCALLSLLLLTRGLAGAAVLVAAGLTFVRYHRIAMREFGGLSGDLAGWFLETAEVWMLCAACLTPYVEELL